MPWPSRLVPVPTSANRIAHATPNPGHGAHACRPLAVDARQTAPPRSAGSKSGKSKRYTLRHVLKAAQTNSDLPTPLKLRPLSSAWSGPLSALQPLHPFTHNNNTSPIIPLLLLRTPPRRPLRAAALPAAAAALAHRRRAYCVAVLLALVCRRREVVPEPALALVKVVARGVDRLVAAAAGTFNKPAEPLLRRLSAGLGRAGGLRSRLTGLRSEIGLGELRNRPSC
jgi:hypothetical protein